MHVITLRPELGHLPQASFRCHGHPPQEKASFSIQKDFQYAIVKTKLLLQQARSIISPLLQLTPLGWVACVLFCLMCIFHGHALWQMHHASLCFLSQAKKMSKSHLPCLEEKTPQDNSLIIDIKKTSAAPRSPAKLSQTASAN